MRIFNGTSNYPSIIPEHLMVIGCWTLHKSRETEKKGVAYLRTWLRQYNIAHFRVQVPLYAASAVLSPTEVTESFWLHHRRY